jgi:hypothetical protein
VARLIRKEVIDIAIGAVGFLLSAETAADSPSGHVITRPVKNNHDVEFQLSQDLTKKVPPPAPELPPLGRLQVFRVALAYSLPGNVAKVRVDRGVLGRSGVHPAISNLRS